MARKKATPTQTTPAVGEEPIRAIANKMPEKLPSSAVRFSVLVLVSLVISSAGFSALSPFLAGDLSSVSGRVDEWWQIVGVLGWKATELAIGWWGEYDGTSCNIFITTYTCMRTVMADCIHKTTILHP